MLVEPTCGRGNFIAAALDTFPNIRKVFGLDIQVKHVAECKSNLLARLLNETRFKPEIHIVQGDMFDDGRLAEFLEANPGPVLVLGNPPWVTNSALSVLNSSNLPVKSNFKAHKGLDALTGKSNFDIAEFILLQLIRTCGRFTATIAMLCKNIVIRNLVASTQTQGLGIKNIRAFTFDAAKEFGVACDASLFVADIAKENASRTCAVAKLGEETGSGRVFGWVGAQFVADIASYRASQVIEGTSPIIWRQGIKHDCSKVMELDREREILINGFGKPVHIEQDRVFPLAKSSDLKSPILNQFRKAVIVPQRAIGEDTTILRDVNPRLWEYLNDYGTLFAARKSSIYKDKPPFSIFGVGNYSFKPYKIALSGLYKISNFSLLLPVNGKPVMLDDTCYLVGFDRLGAALIALALLNSRPVQDFLKSISFRDSKRPYTKELLMRIDLRKVASLISSREIKDFLSSVGAPPHDLDERDFESLFPTQHPDTQSMFVLE